MYKRLLTIIFCLIIICSLTSCSNGNNSTIKSSVNKKNSNNSINPKTHNTPTTIPEENSGSYAFDINNQKLSRVEAKGNNFVINDNVLFFNAVNTPWDNWNDIGGNFDEAFWRNHFALLHKEGVNATRIWISCNGAMLDIDDFGFVIGPKDEFWNDFEKLLQIADENEIYIMATVMSFDNFKDEGQKYLSWRKLFDSEENMNSMINNYIIPLCQKFDSYNSLWSIDLCNEPDWIHENDECGKISFDKICALFAREAVAIHENSDILVTIGFGMIKYNSEKYDGNYGSASYLQGLYNNDLAYIDFNSTHFYEWEATWLGFPFDKNPKAFGLDDTIPAVIGEFPASGMTANTNGSKQMSGAECYVNAYNNGWNGIMAWTSNGVDNCGKLDDFVEGVREVAEMMKK